MSHITKIHFTPHYKKNNNKSPNQNNNKKINTKLAKAYLSLALFFIFAIF